MADRASERIDRGNEDGLIRESILTRRAPAPVIRGAELFARRAKVNDFTGRFMQPTIFTVLHLGAVVMDRLREIESATESG